MFGRISWMNTWENQTWMEDISSTQLCPRWRRDQGCGNLFSSNEKWWAKNHFQSKYATSDVHKLFQLRLSHQVTQSKMQIWIPNGITKPPKKISQWISKKTSRGRKTRPTLWHPICINLDPRWRWRGHHKINTLGVFQSSTGRPTPTSKKLRDSGNMNLIGDNNPNWVRATVLKPNWVCSLQSFSTGIKTRGHEYVIKLNLSRLGSNMLN